MAGTYRPTIIRYLNAQGQRVSKDTPGAKRVREKSKTFWGRCADANGKVRAVALCDDAAAAEAMLAEMKQRAKREARGDIDPFEDHRKRPLADHLADFESAVLAKGATDKQAGQATARCRKIIDGCKFKKLADLSPSAVANYLRGRRQAGLGTATSNGYLSGIKSFANWLVRDQRLPSNPLAHLVKLNDRVDIRHERRALTQQELGGLIAAAERSNEPFRELDGATRAMLYRMATMTGLRASELASLTSASLDLTADPPTVTVQAACSKHRREDVLPLHPDLAARLRQWLTQGDRQQDGQRAVLAFDRASSAKPERLFPGTWATRAFKMVRADLEAAKITYLTDAGVADFHSLRHTFISNLVSGGVHPKVAQQLARHSTITLTMDRYSHLSLIDMTAGLESLPTIVDPELKTMRATGTTDDTADFGCTNGCTRPAEITRFQPKSHATMTTADVVASTNEKPRISAENTGLNEDILDRDRTYNLRLRRPTLYPIELRGQ